MDKEAARNNLVRSSPDAQMKRFDSYSRDLEPTEHTFKPSVSFRETDVAKLF
jgi:hypothetical protein